ncbi:hypothetical protein CM49_04668 [Paenibacillus sp. P1XP2]|nr:hypothetical protein CM49_04668 [Paenibacillus sp. P1XP2]
MSTLSLKNSIVKDMSLAPEASENRLGFGAYAGIESNPQTIRSGAAVQRP